MSACPSVLSGVMRTPADQAGEGVENHLEVSLCLTIKHRSLSQMADASLFYTCFGKKKSVETDTIQVSILLHSDSLILVLVSKHVILFKAICPFLKLHFFWKCFSVKSLCDVFLLARQLAALA